MSIYRSASNTLLGSLKNRRKGPKLNTLAIDKASESSFAPLTYRLCRHNLVYDVPLSLKRKEEKYDERRMRKESEIPSTKPNFGNTIAKLVNTDQEEVEGLQIWQHRNIGRHYPDPNFTKNILEPIEKAFTQGFEMLLRDPIFKNSSIIKDPMKLAEGFNRTSNEEVKKQDKVGYTEVLMV